MRSKGVCMRQNCLKSPNEFVTTTKSEPGIWGPATLQQLSWPSFFPTLPSKELEAPVLFSHPSSEVGEIKPDSKAPMATLPLQTPLLPWEYITESNSCGISSMRKNEGRGGVTERGEGGPAQLLIEMGGRLWSSVWAWPNGPLPSLTYSNRPLQAPACLAPARFSGHAEQPWIVGATEEGPRPPWRYRLNRRRRKNDNNHYSSLSPFVIATVPFPA